MRDRIFVGRIKFKLSIRIGRIKVSNCGGEVKDRGECRR